MNLPASLDIPTLAAWLHDAGLGTEADYDVRPSTRQAHAVRALLSAKIREACREYVAPSPSGIWTPASRAAYTEAVERECARVVDAVLGCAK